MQIQQIRNATTARVRRAYLLVDPMLRQGPYPGFKGTYNQHLRNPLVELPMPAAEVMRGVDAVVITHTHGP